MMHIIITEKKYNIIISYKLSTILVDSKIPQFSRNGYSFNCKFIILLTKLNEAKKILQIIIKKKSRG